MYDTSTNSINKRNSRKQQQEAAELNSKGCNNMGGPPAKPFNSQESIILGPCIKAHGLTDCMIKLTAVTKWSSKIKLKAERCGMAWQ